MVVYGSWHDQDTLTGSATLTPDEPFHDWTGGDANFTVNVGDGSSYYGIRSAGFLTSVQAWDQMRGGDPSSNAFTSNLGIFSDDWYSGFMLQNAGSFGWEATLNLQAFGVDLSAYMDWYLIDPWPSGVIGLDVEGGGFGTQYWDLRIEAIPTTDTGDRSGASGDYRIVKNSPGSLQTTDAVPDTTTTFPQELLASTPAGTTVEYLNVPQAFSSFIGTKILPIPSVLADGASPDVSDPPFDPVHTDIFFQFMNTYAFDVDVTVRRPRWRWVYNTRKAPPCRLWPRDDNQGVGAGRIWPPPRSQQSGRPGGYY